MLPCNVIVQQVDNQTVEVAAINPQASMQAVENEKLKKIAREIEGKLATVIDRL